MTSIRFVPVSVLFAMLFPFTAPVNAAADSVQRPENNFAVTATYEEWDLPGDERMGMAGLGVSHYFTDNFSMGVGSWMAVRGERGGFITLGVDGRLRYPLSENLGVESGVFVGAGGGRGGYNLSGGGLMLRTHAALTYEMGRWGRLGAGVSYVDFPNSGSISSIQPFISLSLPFYYAVESGWDNTSAGSVTGREPSRQHSLSVIGRNLKVLSSAHTDSGSDQDDLTLLGIEWRTYFDDNWYAKLETEGAASGNSTGYMQILTGAGFRLPVTDRLYACADVAIGGGGGGGVDTGSGLMFDAAAGLQLFMTDNLFAELSGGYLSSATGSFEAGSIALKLGYEVGGGHEKQSHGVSEQGVSDDYMRFRIVNQTYFKADERWRSHHNDEDVENLGVQVDYFLDRNWYLTGQGLAAYDGGAGAYMTGLIGTGFRKQLVGGLYLNAEVLAGAAGGGGLAMGSGLVWQGNAGLGYDLGSSVSALVTAGRMEAFDGDFKANVLGLSLAYHVMSSM